MQVKEVVPFLAVRDMKESIAYYVDGLGFKLGPKWEVGGEIRWRRLRIGQAGLMLQQFATEGHDARRFSDNKGEGVTLCFFPEDAVAFYRAVTERGIKASEPVVSNGLWTTHLSDPDGYELLFESATDVPEGARLPVAAST